MFGIVPCIGILCYIVLESMDMNVLWQGVAVNNDINSGDSLQEEEF
jgi:hypothetical protein